MMTILLINTETDKWIKTKAHGMPMAGDTIGDQGQNFEVVESSLVFRGKHQITVIRAKPVKG